MNRPVGVSLAILVMAATPECRRAPVSAGILPAEPSAIPGARIEIPSPKINALFPPDAYAGTRFSVRFDGMSVLGVAGEGFSPDSAVFFGDEPMLTEFVSSDSLVATIPATLIGRTGSVPVSVRDASGGSSPAFPFEIVPPRAAGACPEVLHVYPSSTEAWHGFSVRADGSSSLGVAGKDFGPETFVLLGGRKVATVYQGPRSLIAAVAPDALARRGRISVAVGEGKCSLARSPEDLEVR